jgi:hypothetical protein
MSSPLPKKKKIIIYTQQKKKKKKKKLIFPANLKFIKKKKNSKSNEKVVSITKAHGLSISKRKFQIQTF